MKNLYSSRHQIKSTAKPRQYWLLLKIYPDTSDLIHMRSLLCQILLHLVLSAKTFASVLVFRT